MLLQGRNRSPDLGNNLYAPAENRNQRVRQIAELWESWVQVCYWGWEFFWVRCCLWSWKHLPGTTPGLKPSPIPLDSQQWLGTSFLQEPGTGSGGLEQDAGSHPLFLPQDPPSIREVSQRLPHQPLQLLVLASAPSADSQSRGPTSSLNPGAVWWLQASVPAVFLLCLARNLLICHSLAQAPRPLLRVQPCFHPS